jgi:hypothetical protein
MAIKHSNIFQSKALKNMCFGIFGMKNISWQPWKVGRRRICILLCARREKRTKPIPTICLQTFLDLPISKTFDF